MSESAQIETVFEPGWGETGRTELKDSVMVEQPVGIYKLSEKNVQEYTNELVKIGDTSTPKDIVLFAEKGEKATIYEQAKMAIAYANDELVKQPDFPLVTRTRQTEGRFVISTHSPLTLYHKGKSEWSNTNRASGIKTPEMLIILSKTEGATDAEYVQARHKVVQKANQTLQLFEAKFRIPEFPLDSQLKEI